MHDIDKQGMATISKKVIQIVTENSAGFHLSSDVDVWDPSVINGSGTLVQTSLVF